MHGRAHVHARDYARVLVRTACVALAVVCVQLVVSATAHAASVSVSGHAYFDEADHVWAGCDGATANVSLAVNGVWQTDVPCSKTDGSFTFTNVSLSSTNMDLWVVLDSHTLPTVGASLVSNGANTTSNITDFDVVEDRTWLQSNADSGAGDVAYDDFSEISYDVGTHPGVPWTYTDSDGCDNQCVVGIGKIVIGDTLAGGDVDLEVTGDNSDFWFDATHVEAGSVLHVGTGVTYTVAGSGTVTDCTQDANVMMPLCVDAGATFDSDVEGLVVYLSDKGGNTAVAPLTYGDLQLDGSQNADGGGADEPLTTYILGTDAGQTITTQRDLDVARCDYGDCNLVSVDGGEFGPTASEGTNLVVGEDMQVDQSIDWDGTGTATYTLEGDLDGNVSFNLPNTDIDLAPSEPTVDFGATQDAVGQDWNFHSLSMNPGNAETDEFATAGAGVTYNSSPSPQPDTLTGLGQANWSDRMIEIGTSNAGAAAGSALWEEQYDGWDGTVYNGGAHTYSVSGSSIVARGTSGTIAYGDDYWLYGDDVDVATGDTDGIVMIAAYSSNDPFMQKSSSGDYYDYDASHDGTGTITPTGGPNSKPNGIDFAWPGNAASDYDSARGIDLEGDGTYDVVAVGGTVTPAGGNRDMGIIDYYETDKPAKGIHAGTIDQTDDTESPNYPNCMDHFDTTALNGKTTFDYNEDPDGTVGTGWTGSDDEVVAVEDDDWNGRVRVLGTAVNPNGGTAVIERLWDPRACAWEGTTAQADYSAVPANDDGDYYGNRFGNVDTDGDGKPDTFVYNFTGTDSYAATAMSNGFIVGTRTSSGHKDIFEISTNVFAQTIEGLGNYDEDGDGSDETYLYDPGAGNAATATSIACDDGGCIVGGQYTTAANGGDELMLRTDDNLKLDTTWWPAGSDGDGIWTRGTTQGATQLADKVGAIFTNGYDGFWVGEDDRGASTDTGEEGQVRAFTQDGQLQSGTGTADVRLYDVGRDDFTSGGAQSIHLAGDLDIGTSASTGTAAFDLDEYDIGFDVGGSVNVGAHGWLRAPSDTPLEVGGNFEVASGGNFTPQSGTVTFDSGQVSTVSLPPVSASGNHDLFYGLTATGAGHKMLFDPTNTLNVTHSLSLTGSSCSGKLGLDSTSPTVNATIDALGATVDLDSLDINRITASPALSATHTDLTANASGITATTTCGLPANTPPNDLLTGNASAQSGMGGETHATDISTQTPHFSVTNRQANATKMDVQVLSDPIDSSVIGLWHEDGTGADSSGKGHPFLASPTPPYDSTSPKFGSGDLNFGATGQEADVASSTDFDTGTFTVSMWINTTAANVALRNHEVIFQRESSGGLDQIYIDFEKDGGRKLEADSEDVTTGDYLGAETDASNVDDGKWHLITVTQRKIAGVWIMDLYVDDWVADEEAPGVSPYTPVVATGEPIQIGRDGSNSDRLAAKVDETEMWNRALTGPEIAGYYRTGLPHGQTIWDSGLQTISGGPIAANVQTPDVVYGQAGGSPATPQSLTLSGARYYVQAQTSDGTTLTNWSEPDWFETVAGGSVTIETSDTVPLGIDLTGTDETATSTVGVSSTGEHGYTLAATAAQDMTSGVNSVPWIAMTPAVWNANADDGVGLTVLSSSASGGKDAATWGTGTTPDDFANLDFGGLDRYTPQDLATTSTYSTLTDDVVVGWRADVPAATPPGFYEGVVQFTATANP